MDLDLPPEQTVHVEVRLGNTLVVYDGPLSTLGQWLAFWLRVSKITFKLPEPPRVERIYLHD